jgi:hypothetical protein
MVNSQPSVPSRMSWIDLIDESVHTYDDIDIGDVDAVSRDFVVVKRGYINVHYYYIPMSKVEGWDGHILWLKITEEKVKRDYERGAIPDPSRYYVKDYPGYFTSDYPELRVISPRYARPVYTAKDTTASPEYMRSYRCDLCSTTYTSEDELSSHVAAKH